MTDLVEKLRDGAEKLHGGFEAQTRRMRRAADEIERLTGEVTRLSRERRDSLDALSELVCLKDLKDKHGKTAPYLRRQPKAWEQAKAVLTAANAWLQGPSDAPEKGQ